LHTKVEMTVCCLLQIAAERILHGYEWDTVRLAESALGPLCADGYEPESKVA